MTARIPNKEVYDSFASYRNMTGAIATWNAVPTTATASYSGSKLVSLMNTAKGV